VPLSSIPRLSRIDLVTTDFATLRAAVELPIEVLAPLGAVTLEISWRPASGPQRARKFTLVEGTAPEDRVGLPPATAGARLTTYRLTEVDTVALEAFRAELVDEGRRSGGGRGLITVGASRICRIGDAHDRPIPVAALLRTSETGGYVVAFRVNDMRQTLREAGAEPGPLPTCRAVDRL
jgi:hypothetical protein